MPQIFDVTANENASYKRNELELLIIVLFTIFFFKLLGVADYLSGFENTCLHG